MKRFVAFVELVAVLWVLSAGISRDSAAAQDRTYFIAAEEVLWDYAPSYPIDPMDGQEFSDEEKVFVAGNGTDRIGRVYRKARYVEYTDATFATPKPIEEKWRHLGVLGPAIRANVGDTLRIVFKNKASFPATMHPHGVFYRKDSEGTPYDDGTEAAEKKDDSVPPGEVYTYTWEVPERAGPGPQDPSSVVWLYHSHVDEVADTNAGLVGPLIVYRKGVLRPDGSVRGVDKEFVVLFSVFDENASKLLDRNAQEFAPQADRADDDFVESNLMHGMNGYVYSNLHSLEMTVGDRVRWYQIGLGTEVDLHTPHWHGNTLLLGGTRVDVANLLPATHLTLDMRPDNPGMWMYHCHVNDHIKAGMMAHYRVSPRSGR